MNKVIAAASSNETRASSIYYELKDDILNGKLKPGCKLLLAVLKSDYNVGNSPLREALTRLSATGMVVREENKGFRVSPASIDELKEIIRTRCWLEEIALRESMRNGDDAYDEKIILAVHRLSRASKESLKVQEDLHRDFHFSLISACNSQLLLSYCAKLHEQTLRYRNLSAVVEYREGHEAIRDAILARDEDKAVKLLLSHYHMIAEILINSGGLT